MVLFIVYLLLSNNPHQRPANIYNTRFETIVNSYKALHLRFLVGSLKYLCIPNLFNKLRLG